MSHDRTAMHSGTDIDLVILLASAVGIDPAGTDLHAVLAGIDARIRAVEQRDPLIGNFSLAAILQRTISSTRTLNAIVRREGSSTRTLDAVLRRTEATSATLDAYVFAGEVLGSFMFDGLTRRGISGSLVFDAVIADRYFVFDAVIAGTGSTDFQSDTFQSDTFE